MKVDIARLRELLEEGTPRPWSLEKPPTDSEGWQLGVLIGATRGGKIYATPDGGQFPAADARLICEAVNALPALLDEREVLREIIQQCMSFISGVHGDDFLVEIEAAIAKLEERG